MINNKKMEFISRKGQVVVFVLLLGLMGLTLGLSQISRSLSDLKQVTYVDAGIKAFAGAEAGLQFALNDLSNKININQPISPENCSQEIPIKDALNVGEEFANITYSLCPQVGPYVLFRGTPSDEPREIELSQISPSVTGVDIVWHNPSNPQTAIEVIVIDGMPAMGMLRYIYGPSNLSNSDTAFLQSLSYHECNQGNFNLVSDGHCARNIPVSSNYRLLRIKPLASSLGNTDIAVIARGSGSALHLGPSTYTITATATTKSGVTKKLQVVKIPPSLPGVFDNVFYSGGSIVSN